MSFFLKNKKYFVFLLAAAVVSNFMFLPIAALAQNITGNSVATPPGQTTAAKDDSNAGGVVGWLAGKTVLFTSSVISAILGSIFGVILFIEAQIIDYMLSPNNFSFTGSPVVTLGWGITRDLSNMFLILILLVIAFATVLKIQSYAIKQLWWKVVAVALLINFSLVFAGVIIDFAQVMTTFFLKQALGGDTGFNTGAAGTITTRLASSMQILNFYNPSKPDGALAGIGQFGASAIAAVIGIILTLVGLVITVFVFGATAIFLVVRIIYIWFLLIVIPIVCIFWILPATSGYFSKWWSTFFNWTFFAPAYMFMIYLSLSLFDAQGKLNTKAFWAFSGPGWNTAPPGLSQVGMPSAIFQWILVIAMMFGSLIVAKSFGVLPAKLISGVTGATKGAAKAAGLWGIKAQGQAALGARNFGASSSSGIVRGVTAPIRFLGKIPGLQTLGGLATGAKGGKFTAPLKNMPAIPLGWKSTPLSILSVVTQGAIAGSGIFKKKKQKFKLPSGETIELDPVEEKPEEEDKK